MELQKATNTKSSWGIIICLMLPLMLSVHVEMTSLLGTKFFGTSDKQQPAATTALGQETNTDLRLHSVPSKAFLASIQTLSVHLAYGKNPENDGP
mmetsp:Transcript_17837/g.32852  ORF Transcript_17837/g.32852 Transcript_17837/m.32852 type:complete len:95 (+) Transcript_17837:319-603(+)